VNTMFDVVLLLAGCALFLLAVAYVHACNRL
jgi:hypothetical protein